MFGRKAKTNSCQPKRLTGPHMKKIANTKARCDAHPNDAMAAANLARLEKFVADGRLR